MGLWVLASSPVRADSMLSRQRCLERARYLTIFMQTLYGTTFQTMQMSSLTSKCRKLCPQRLSTRPFPTQLYLLSSQSILKANQSIPSCQIYSQNRPRTENLRIAALPCLGHRHRWNTRGQEKQSTLNGRHLWQLRAGQQLVSLRPSISKLKSRSNLLRNDARCHGRKSPLKLHMMTRRTKASE